MVSITCYGGANEIGGNKILLEDKGVKIYLDFGQSFSFGEDFFYEYLAPRKANGLEVYFEFDMLPKTPRLYSESLLKLTELKYQKPDVDAVLISHAHADHIGHLEFLDEGIPVYMGHGAHRITEVYHDLYPSLSDIGGHKDIRLFKSGDILKIGHLKIEPIHVDHSIPGAYGFIIRTSKGPVVYTGDFRIHGPRADMSGEFAEKAAAAKPRALLCEGTRVGHEPPHNYSEAEVEQKASQLVKASKGLVLAYFSMSNIDRFMCFYNAAKKNNRVLVLGTRLACIIRSMKDKIKVLPDVMTDKNIAVYFRISKSCTFNEKDYFVWEREYMPRMVTYKDISKNPRKYLMHLGFYGLMELVYLQPKDADFIYSMSEHFYEGDDNEEQRTVWENWMGHFGIRFHQVHSSGHASESDILSFIKQLGPRTTIPIHTNSPDAFDKAGCEIAKPRKGETIEI
jgi:ribonuclease J